MSNYKSAQLGGNVSKNCLSYWYPILEMYQIPTPDTLIFKTDLDLLPYLDGERPPGIDSLLDEMKTAMQKWDKYPLFLRSGLFSSKHNWENTCLLQKPEDLENHIATIVCDGEMVSFLGMATDVWVLREFLELKTITTLPNYGNMPLAREFRGFVGHGAIQCIHPYWPVAAVKRGKPIDPNWQSYLEDMNRMGPDERDIFKLFSEVASAFDFDEHSFSVDICQTKDGRWLVTDMALAKDSFHWPDCDT